MMQCSECSIWGKGLSSPNFGSLVLKSWFRLFEFMLFVMNTNLSSPDRTFKLRGGGGC